MKYLLLFSLIFSSCRYFNVGPTLIYEHNFNYSSEMIDSACIIFMNRHKEHQIEKSLINKVINKYFNRDTIDNKKMSFYMKHHYYYPFGPGIMNKYYLCKSSNTNLFYSFTVADLSSHNSIQLVSVKKDSVDSKSIFHYSLPRVEENKIKEKFKKEIISKIEDILSEMK